MPGTKISKRTFLKQAAAAAILPAVSRSSRSVSLASSSNRPPNVIFINADDLGYGDIGIYGSSIRTPNIDALARAGVRLVNYNSASPVCSPSRAALLTGRYSTRVGVPGVLMSGNDGGLSTSETTIAEMLKAQDYKTICVGKWHLGSQPQLLPTSRGFDEFFGMPFSNDIAPLQLMHNCDVIENPVDLDTLTQRYTDQAVQFIENSRNSPFFLYLAYAMPHIPLAVCPSFKGRSALGIYGDAVEEIDWSVGQVIDALSANGLDQDSVVMFSSDNGPSFQGSPGRLRGRKSDSFEGGVRMPFIAYAPGRIHRNLVSSGVASSMDILPTVARLCGASRPSNPLDGIDIWPLLTGEQEDISRDILLYFDNWNIQCARLGKWKVHVARYNSYSLGPAPACGRMNLPLPQPELYDLNLDPDESYDVSDRNQDIVKALVARIEALVPTFPQQVGNAWRATKSIPVENTQPGALPIAKQDS
jgi:arylsulfatase A